MGMHVFYSIMFQPILIISTSFYKASTSLLVYVVKVPSIWTWNFSASSQLQWQVGGKRPESISRIPVGFCTQIQRPSLFPSLSQSNDACLRSKDPCQPMQVYLFSLQAPYLHYKSKSIISCIIFLALVQKPA